MNCKSSVFLGEEALVKYVLVAPSLPPLSVLYTIVCAAPAPRPDAFQILMSPSTSSCPT